MSNRIKLSEEVLVDDRVESVGDASEVETSLGYIRSIENPMIRLAVAHQLRAAIDHEIEIIEAEEF